VNKYLKLPKFNVAWMCQSGEIDTMSVKGGTRTAVSAKLILSANANGMRKNTSKNSSGGRMMSHLPCRFSQFLRPWASRDSVPANVTPPLTMP
jgi:hypothetical protein